MCCVGWFHGLQRSHQVTKSPLVTPPQPYFYFAFPWSGPVCTPCHAMYSGFIGEGVIGVPTCSAPCTVPEQVISFRVLGLKSAETESERDCLGIFHVFDERLTESPNLHKSSHLVGYKPFHCIRKLAVIVAGPLPCVSQETQHTCRCTWSWLVGTAQP